MARQKKIILFLLYFTFIPFIPFGFSAGPSPVHETSRNNGVELIAAAFRGDSNQVKTVLAKGAEVNFQGTDGVTALYIAAQNGHMEVVEALLAHQAKVNLQGNNGATALMVAARGGQK